MGTEHHYGPLQRRLRLAVEVTLGDLARHVGVSVTYLAGVEVGRNPPPADDKLELIARCIKADPKLLLEAKAMDKGGVKVPIPEGAMARQLVLDFARRDRAWTDEELAEALARYGFVRQQVKPQ